MKKISPLAVAALALTVGACSGIYGPNDDRVVGVAAVHCGMWDKTDRFPSPFPGCDAPEGAKKVGGLFVKKD